MPGGKRNRFLVSSKLGHRWPINVSDSIADRGLYARRIVWRYRELTGQTFGTTGAARRNLNAMIESLSARLGLKIQVTVMHDDRADFIAG